MLAAVLSLLINGLGQVYNGQIGVFLSDENRALDHRKRGHWSLQRLL
jgi:hypothetical protein